MANKKEIIGGGVAGILGKPQKTIPKTIPSNPGRVEVATPMPKPEMPRAVFDRGRPRAGYEHFGKDLQFLRTSLFVEVGIYEKVREFSYANRTSLKEAFHRVLEAGIRALEKEDGDEGR